MNTQEGIGRGLRKGMLAVGVAALAVAVAVPATAEAATTQRSSVKGKAIQAKGRSEEPSISTNGRYVAFNSNASNLVNNDTNGVDDCFVRDHYLKKTSIVGVSSSWVRGNGKCYGPSISGNGKFVAFESKASNLIAGGGDTNGLADIYVRDLVNKKTRRVSVRSSGQQANGASGDPAISENGRYVVFESVASNLVADDTNGTWDVFLHDRSTSQTTRVSVGVSGQANAGSFDPSISADGKWVVFESDANNLVNNDTNGQRDIFIHKVAKGVTTRVSVKSGGAQAKGASVNPSVSGNGRFVAFDSAAKNLVWKDTNGSHDVFVHDRKNNATKRVSVKTGGGQVNNWSFDPTISKNGRYISFTSAASNLVKKDTNGKWDGFVHDRWKKTTKRVSVRAGGGQANGASDDVAISGDGKYVAFESFAKNLVNNDTNKKKDIFRRGALY